MNKVRNVGIALLVLLWVALAGFAWFGPKKDSSDAERRPLAQMPEISVETLLDGKFMTQFESYTLDQFPLRDRFRQLKSLNHYYVFNQKDNNGIYIAQGHAAQMEYPLNEESVEHALSQFQKVYDRYLKDSNCKIYTTVVPDKGYYLADQLGYPALDYNTLLTQMRQKLPWA